MLRLVRHLVLILGIVLAVLVSAGGASAQPAQPPAVPTLERTAVDAAGRAWVTGSVATTTTTFVRYYEGAAWHALPAPPVRYPGPILPLAKDDVWVVGERIAHWNGRSWTVTSHPKVPGLSLADIAGKSPDDIWVVGRQNGLLMQLPGDGPGEQTQLSKPLIMHWDGTAWTLVPVPGLPGEDQGLQAVAAGGKRVWAVGAIQRLENADQIGSTSAGPLFSHEPLALQWWGGAWHRVRHANAGDGGTRLVDVDVLPGGVAWIVGIVQVSAPGVIDASEHGQTIVEQRMDGQWSVRQRADVAPRWLPWSIAAASNSRVWVAGVDRRGWPSVERWNGTGWHLRLAEDLGWRSQTSGLMGEPYVAAGRTNAWLVSGVTFFTGQDVATADPVIWRHSPAGWTKIPFTLH